MVNFTRTKPWTIYPKPGVYLRRDHFLYMPSKHKTSTRSYILLHLPVPWLGNYPLFSPPPLKLANLRSRRRLPTTQVRREEDPRPLPQILCGIEGIAGQVCNGG